MTDRPMLFSTQMVQALLQGRKTVTRRVVTKKTSVAVKELWHLWDFSRARPVDEGLEVPYIDASSSDAQRELVRPLWRPRDTIWVRETFQEFHTEDGVRERWCYAADAAGVPDEDARPWGWPGTKYEGRPLPWKPGIHMPREACRIRLLVDSVRAERVQEITEADAIAEGVGTLGRVTDPRGAYIALWDSLNAERAPWMANGWVWVLRFGRRAGA